MATPPLLEYVPYTDEDEEAAIARQPQVFGPTLVAEPQSPSDPVLAPVLQFPRQPPPETSLSTRTLLILAACVVLLASFLVLALHSHTRPAAAAASHTRQLAPGAQHPVKPSAYGEAFTPTAPVRKPKTPPTR